MRVVFALLLLGLGLTVLPIPASAQDSYRLGAGAQDSYRLGAGDRVRVLLYGEEDLSGTFGVDGEGRLALPLVGSVRVDGLTLEEAEKVIGGRFAEGYVNDPRVAVEVLDHRPFYILGEVRNPGAYPWAEHLTVLAAVAKAGGFTYRANERTAEVSRDGGPPERLDVFELVQPGDVIRVRQRLF